MNLDRSLSSCRLVMVFTLFVGASSIISVSAQQKQPVKPACPLTRVTCPDSVYAKDSLTFTTGVSGGDLNVTPTYNWTVSAGSISSGQGTSTIHVDTSEVPPDSTITATVDVGGFDRACGYGSTTSSCTNSVLKKAAALKLDEYGKIKSNDENSRLDNVVLELTSDPMAQAHLISYNAPTNRPGDAQRAAARAKDYLVKKRKLDPSRVVIVDGGSREQPAIELWIVPSGAEPPTPTPTANTATAKPEKPTVTTPKPKPAYKKKNPY